MIAYTRGKLIHLIKLDFVRFSIVGGTGFVINLAILTGLHRGFNVPIFVSQLIGAEIALFSNFILHNNWTYKHKKVHKTFRTLLFQFHATTWPAILGSTLMVGAGVRFLNLSSLTALIISSIVAFSWNFIWSKYVVWRSITNEQIEEIAS
jgi:dolichol-phosphate mannosyltransferase